MSDNDHRSVLPDEMTVDSLGRLALFLGGDLGDFTGKLLVLCHTADQPNLMRLYGAFPEVVAAWLAWRASPAPTVAQLRERLASAPGALQRTAAAGGDLGEEVWAMLTDRSQAALLAAVVAAAGGTVTVDRAALARPLSLLTAATADGGLRLATAVSVIYPRKHLPTDREGPR